MPHANHKSKRYMDFIIPITNWFRFPILPILLTMLSRPTEQKAIASMGQMRWWLIITDNDPLPKVSNKILKEIIL